VKVSCQECPKLFEAKRRGALFCGPTCRKRSSDRDIAARKAGELAPVTPISQPETPIESTETGLVAETRRALEEADAVSSVHGQIALTLAAKLARAVDTGSAMASLAKQLSIAMTEALASGTKKADSLDELAARRMQRASGA
jgi:hypothetical protein